MNILAIDGASQQASVAISRDGSVMATSCEPNAPAQRMLPLLIAFFRECGAPLEAIDAVVVSTGPGSFTGLRCSLVLARMLAATRRIPCYGVSAFRLQATLAAGAQTFDGLIWSVIETRKDHLFAQLFTRRGQPVTVPALAGELRLAAIAPGEPLLVVGDAFDRMLPMLLDAGRRARPAECPPTPLAAILAGIVVDDTLNGLPPILKPVPAYFASPVCQ